MQNMPVECTSQCSLERRCIQLSISEVSSTDNASSDGEVAPSFGRLLQAWICTPVRRACLMSGRAGAAIAILSVAHQLGP